MKVPKELIEACKKGHRIAQKQLYEQCFQVLARVCFRYKTNEQDAIAALNEGFYKILTKLHLYRENVPFEAWIKRIMLNTLIDDHRKQKRSMQHSEVEYLNGIEYKGRVDYNLADLRFDAEALRQLIRSLPEATREVFNLFAIDGYSHAEISNRIGISVGTSKWHVSQARKVLQAKIRRSLEAPKHKNYG